MQDKTTISVSQLNVYIKSLIDGDAVLSSVMVRGELSNCKVHSSGHIYMTIKDEQSSIRAVMFKGAASKLKFLPQNGMKIICGGRVSVFERDGAYQLYVEFMQPDGIGALHMAFEQLKEKLQNEGLFSQESKKPLPRYPKQIGVVTAPTGAAIRDILNVLARRYKCADVIICPVLVQGDGAAAQIASAIDYLNKNKLADVMIVGRGGGSIEDLWTFNEEIVARAIAQSQIPIISAVGHEVDFTIADFVADMRAPTPSAAAELAVPSQIELAVAVKSAAVRSLNAHKHMIDTYKNRLKVAFSERVLKKPIQIIEQKRQFLDYMCRDLENSTSNIVQQKQVRFAAALSSIEALSPIAVMARGYCVAVQKGGGTVRSANSVKRGDVLDLIYTDGKVECEVK